MRIARFSAVFTLIAALSAVAAFAQPAPPDTGACEEPVGPSVRIIFQKAGGGAKTEASR